MTDAYVCRDDSNITAAADQLQEDHNENNVDEEECSPVANLNCNCTETVESKEHIQKHSNVSSNSSNNDSASVIGATTDSQNNQSDTVGTTDPNAVLKYVHKKNEIKDIPTKTTGHPKNSLRRRKRNLENLKGTEAPLILNYETSHGPQRDVETWEPAKNTAYTIKHAALADFNIETLHDNEQLKHIHGPSTESIPENSNESNDRQNYRNNHVKSRTSSEDSNERNSDSNENSRENQHYQSNERFSNPRENRRNENTSDERESHSSIEADKTGTQRIAEDLDSKEYDKSKYRNSHNRDEESIENGSEETEHQKGSYRREKERQSTEDDSKPQYIAPEKYHYQQENVSKASLPATIQDVDLGEYERIQVNKNGQIETAKDNYESTAFDPAKDIIFPSKPDIELLKSDKISSLSNENSESSSSETQDHKAPTHINDGEIKPVVELNSETDSTESSDENSTEDLKAKLENESLESLTGINEKDSNEKSDKLKENKETQSQDDVKQQFERIPLNYNHADKTPTKDSKIEHVESKEQVNDNRNNEGTVDEVQPRYDENLNIKFDDIHIKLPEIKLPDDVLAYAYENPPVYKEDDEKSQKPSYYQDHPNYKRNKEEQVERPAYYRQNKEKKKKPRFYHYHDEDKEELPAQIKQEDDEEPQNDEYNDYYDGYYKDEKKKENYQRKQKNEEEEEQDDDLYEKFVRERFGKSGTFEKRLEKLTDYKAQNPHLYQKVQKILKKTEDVKAEAEKSGDPNAGYMWTLEYGEKL